MKTKRMSIVFFCLLLLLGLLLSSCATIFSGTRGKVQVEIGSPENAQVFLDGNFIGNAPCKLKVSKNSLHNGQSILEIRAEGYETARITLNRRVCVGWVIVDLLTGVVELGVDFATGAIYKPSPKQIKYNLQKSK